MHCAKQIPIVSDTAHSRLSISACIIRPQEEHPVSADVLAFIRKNEKIQKNFSFTLSIGAVMYYNVEVKG